MTESNSAESESVSEAGAPILGHRRLSRELHQLVDSLDGQDTTLGVLVGSIGERGFGLLLALLALPAALPLPAPGYATPFGVMMILLGSQLVLGRRHPKLPGRARRQKIRYSTLRRTIRGASFPLRVAEFLVRPRLRKLARYQAFLAFVGILVIVMAAFMSIPVPLTNTVPSFVIFLLACGLLEEDGLLLLGGVVLAPAAAALGVAALYYAWTLGFSALDSGLSGLVERIFGS